MKTKFDRRLFLGACALTAVGKLRAASFECSTRQSIAALVPQSGPWADEGADMLRGISSAAKETGCAPSISTYDTGNLSSRIPVAASRAVQRENSTIVIGKLGVMTPLVAKQNPGALIVNLNSPIVPIVPNPSNAIAIPFDYFFELNPEKNKGSFGTQAFFSTLVVLDTIRESSDINTPEELVTAMSNRTFSIPRGSIKLDKSSLTFSLI